MDELPNFTKLQIWQLAHDLTLRVYRITGKFPAEEKYGLTSQLKRAAVSVESNIAESHGRYHYSDAVKFLIEARGSCQEAQSQLLVALDLNYPGKEMMMEVISKYTQLVKQINALISYKRKRKSKLTKREV